MKMTFTKSDINDAARVAGTYLEAKIKFFQYHQFLILPYARYKCIYLPDIDYSILRKITIDPSYHPEDFKKEFLEALLSQLKDHKDNKEISLDDIKSTITELKNTLESKVKFIFPVLWKKIDSIEVIITRYGTEGSFDFKKIRNKYKLFIWIRDTGCSIDEVNSVFIHCYVSIFVLISTNIVDSLSVEWKKREAIIDFLISNVFYDIHKKVSVTLPHIESTQRANDIEHESEMYLKRLKLNMESPVVRKKGDSYSINDKYFDIHSKKARALFDLLYLHKNHFVTKDDILNTLYSEFEGSEWSVSKIIERLRKEIEKSGTTFPLIKTSRNMGYKLVVR